MAETRRPPRRRRSRGAARPCTGALHTIEDHISAARFLREAAHPPTTPAAQAAWRARWLPWLLGQAPGPTGPTMIC